MEASTLRWIEPGIYDTEPDVVRSLPDYAVSVRGASGTDCADGHHRSHCVGCYLPDNFGRSAPWFRRSLSAQLLLDVPVSGDVVLASAVFPELVCGLAVHLILANSVVFRDWYAARACSQGVFSGSIRCGLYDASVPAGIHLHASDEHAIISATVVARSLVCSM